MTSADWIQGLPTPLALAVVAVMGYLIGWRRRRDNDETPSARRELNRARHVVRQLESIAKRIQHHLSNHRGSLERFKQTVSQLNKEDRHSAWERLSDEADDMLKPTLQLATHIAQAYDEIRQQANLLMTFTEIRTDPLTGLSNRRALDESLETLFAMLTRYQNSFSVGIFDIDHFKKVNDNYGHLYGDEILRDVAQAFDDCARETDIVTRYGGEEFVVAMPETNLRAAAAFAERVRQRVEETLPVTISGGVTLAVEGETAATMLGRADAALYAAKSGGRNRTFQNAGESTEEVCPSLAQEYIKEMEERDPESAATIST